MSRFFILAMAAASVVLTLAASPASAVIVFDQNVTPNVIYGSGNTNGSFTVDRNNGVELGLRGKLRFDANNQGQNVFNSNGDGTYTFSTGSPNLSLPLPSWADATTPIWSFDWSINTDFNNASPFVAVGVLTYRIDIDFDPGVGTTNFLSFDPIFGLPPTPDHSFGNNSTAQGGGVEATSSSQYTTLTLTNNVAQNSWNMEFFDAPASPFTFDPNVPGEYTIVLTALAGGSVPVSSVSIDIIAVPEASAGIAGLIICGIVGSGWSLRRFFAKKSA